jgi:hypothetical protein
MTILALLALTLQSLVFSGASFLSSTSDLGHVVVAGSVSHANDRDGTAVVSAANMYPGASRWGDVTLTGGEDVTAGYSVVNLGATDTPDAPSLSAALRLRVEDVTGAPATPPVLFDDALSAFSTVGLATIAPNEARTFRFTLVWSAAAADPALQGAGTTVQLQFVGVSL